MNLLKTLHFQCKKIVQRPLCLCGRLNGKPKKTAKKSSSRKNACEEPLRLGRFGSSLKIGIVGVPNIGKSTFFNCLTNSEVAAENYPFCTIDPNESQVRVPDHRFEYLCELYKPASQVPAFLKVVDIAGLIEGSSEGAGLGNAFLSHVSACDAIFHLLRTFDNIEVSHVTGKVDPIRDVELISKELRLKDIEFFKNKHNQLSKLLKRKQDTQLQEEMRTIDKVLKHLEIEEKNVRFMTGLEHSDVKVLNQCLPLTAKPVIYLCNLSADDYINLKTEGGEAGSDIPWMKEIQQWVCENDSEALIVPFSGAYESELLQNREMISPDEHLVASALPAVIKSGFSLLKLENFFTVGKDEVKAWTIQSGTKAPQAAGKIHSDFEKGFVIAEVIKFEDLQFYKCESAIKAAGKRYQKGREYVVNDGDVIHFRINLGKTNKKK